ncbi:MAG: RNA pyrophosphohydrolase [Pseudomonadota bacterium]
MNSNLPYRDGVGIMLINNDKKVFVAKRIDMRAEAWQMPQGGIDAGESPETTAKRELLEEIGTDKAVIIAESADWYFYDLPNDLQPKIWGGKYRGQKQKWFLMQFTGSDKDINIATKEPEFSEWKWAEVETLPDLIVPFKKNLYIDIVEKTKIFQDKKK